MMSKRIFAETSETDDDDDAYGMKVKLITAGYKSLGLALFCMCSDEKLKLMK